MENTQNTNNGSTKSDAGSQAAKGAASSQNPVPNVQVRKSPKRHMRQPADTDAMPSTRVTQLEMPHSSSTDTFLTDTSPQQSSMKDAQYPAAPVKPNPEGKAVMAAPSAQFTTASYTSSNPLARNGQVHSPQQAENDSPVQTKIASPDLTKPRKEWGTEEYAFFVQEFNKSSCIREIKTLLGQERLEKIQTICSQCDLMGLPISKEKMSEYFLKEREGRWRSRIVKVCNGEYPYIRISSALTEQFGLKLKVGQEFEFFVDEDHSGQRFMGLKEPN